MYKRFVSLCGGLIVVLLGASVYTNHQLAQAQLKQADALREFVIMKPFPILCRNQVSY